MATVANFRGGVRHGLLRISGIGDRLFTFDRQHSTATWVRESPQSLSFGPAEGESQPQLACRVVM